MHGTIDQLGLALTKLNDAGAGIFMMVNAGDGRGRKAENVTRVRAVFADFDGTPLPERLADRAASDRREFAR